MTKVVGQSLSGNTVLLDIGNGEGRMVDLVSRSVFGVTKIARLVRNFPWIPFKGNDEDVFAILKEKGIKG